MDSLVLDRATRIVVTCGSGGVGKTTTAAAMALRAAEAGRRTVVLTIDPARRLAQSMGLTELDNTPRPVKDIDESSGGELFAMMLDMKRTFDDVVSAHSTPERAEQIFANPFYQSLSSSFAGTQEYMAMEKLGSAGSNPTSGTSSSSTLRRRDRRLDFLDAPNRLGRFLDGRMIRLLTAPARAGGKRVPEGRDRRLRRSSPRSSPRSSAATCSATCRRSSAALESMFGGFRERAEHTYELLKAPGHRVRGRRRAGARRAARGVLLRRAALGRAHAAGRAGGEPGASHRDHVAGIAALTAPRAEAAADALAEQRQRQRGGTAGDSHARPRALAEAALRVHAEIADGRRARRPDGPALRRRAHPDVAVVSVPALPADVHDLDGLRDDRQTCSASAEHDPRYRTT